MDLRAKELVNDVSDLFDTKLVDEGVCDDFDFFMTEINDNSRSYKLFVDIYDIFEHIAR